MDTKTDVDASSLSRVHNAGIFILFIISLAVFITAGDLVLNLMFNGVSFDAQQLIR